MANFLHSALQRPEKFTFGVSSGKAISIPKPEYPAEARTKHLSGKVTVDVMIDEDGKVISARAVSGPPELRKAAEAAALKARFTPTKLSGTPVKVKGAITYDFSPQ
jgi:protein TonB